MTRPAHITKEEFHALLRMAKASDAPFDVDVETLHFGDATLVLRHHPSHLRPGLRVSGPVLFTLADVALWAMALSVLGPEPMAVTSELSIRFLRPAVPSDLRAHATGLKLEGRLLVGQVSIASGDLPVAHAVGTYVAPTAD